MIAVFLMMGLGSACYDSDKAYNAVGQIFDDWKYKYECAQWKDHEKYGCWGSDPVWVHLIRKYCPDSCNTCGHCADSNEAYDLLGDRLYGHGHWTCDRWEDDDTFGCHGSNDKWRFIIRMFCSASCHTCFDEDHPMMLFDESSWAGKAMAGVTGASLPMMSICSAVAVAGMLGAFGMRAYMKRKNGASHHGTAYDVNLNDHFVDDDMRSEADA